MREVPGQGVGRGVAVKELQADQEPADADQMLCDLGPGACPLCVQQRPVNFLLSMLCKGLKPPRGG